LRLISIALKKNNLGPINLLSSYSIVKEHTERAYIYIPNHLVCQELFLLFLTLAIEIADKERGKLYLLFLCVKLYLKKNNQNEKDTLSEITGQQSII